MSVLWNHAFLTSLIITCGFAGCESCCQRGAIARHGDAGVPDPFILMSLCNTLL